MSWPRISTRPDPGDFSPARSRSSDDFPDPFGPIRPKVSPSATVSETSFTMVLRRTPQIRFCAITLMSAALPGKE